MSWRPGSDQGAGGEPGPGRGAPAGSSPADAGPGGERDAFSPSATLAVAVDAASGPAGRSGAAPERPTTTCPARVADDLHGRLSARRDLSPCSSAGFPVQRVGNNQDREDQERKAAPRGAYGGFSG